MMRKPSRLEVLQWHEAKVVVGAAIMGLNVGNLPMAVPTIVK